MKRLLLSATLLFTIAGAHADLPVGPPAKIDFSWRKQAGDFPKDKPAYLILVTEDALRWSRMLPEFVAHKEKVGFRVYVATEKDFGSGKIGNEQALHVRAWLRDFQKRTGAKYALFIGDSSPTSADLPSPTRPDGERTGMDEAYRDLDGKCGEHPGDWVESYLRSLPSGPPRSQHNTADELMMGRVSYLGNEIGCSAYDLDRILAKFIRYENETLSGKDLQWRGRALTVVSNYGGSGWDIGLRDTMEKAGGTFEHNSTCWNMADPNNPIFGMIPENFAGPSGGVELTESLMYPMRRYGLMTNMSHGCNRGSEGIIGQGELLWAMDDRHPAVVGVAACTAFHTADNCNMGQSHLRRDAVFAIGTSHSGNNDFRSTLLQRLVTDRLTIGETMQKYCRFGTGIIWYGEPSLRVLPPAGEPLATLQVNPTEGYRYEERTLDYSRPLRPLERTYTVANNSKKPMSLVVSTPATWLSIDRPKLEIRPGETAKIEVRSNASTAALPAGAYLAPITFRNTTDGIEEERRIGLTLQPLTLESYHSFDDEIRPGAEKPAKSTAFTDFARGDFIGSVNNTPGTVALPSPAAAKPGETPAKPWMTREERGRVGGAIRFNTAGTPLDFNSPDYLSWRGMSASFWLKLDALPAAAKQTRLLRAPFTLNVDDKGALLASRDGKPVTVGVMKPGTWHFITIRSDLANGALKTSLDAKPEVACAFPATRSLASTLGFISFPGCLDEVQLWSGEWSDADRAKVISTCGRVVDVCKPIPALRANAHPDTRLEWRPVNQSAKAKYLVYLGASEYAVASAGPAGGNGVSVLRSDTPFVTPAALAENKVYFWRVDIEGATTRGPVWSFRTLKRAYRLLHPETEYSAAADARPFTDPHRGQLLRTPTVYTFGVPADTKPGKAYLYIKGFTYPWYGYPTFTLNRLDDGAAGMMKADAYQKAAKTKVATGTFDRGGMWLDVSGFITPGKTAAFAVEAAPGVNLNLFTLANSDRVGDFGCADVNRPATTKLVIFPGDAQPMAFAERLPKMVVLTAEKPTVDIAAGLPVSSSKAAVTFTLEGAPDWVVMSPDGTVSLRPGVDINELDFGGYDGVLTVKVAGGPSYERPFKVRIPIPNTGIKMTRGKDGTVEFVSANGAPLSKGEIRFTTDGSPVKADSPVYTAPFRMTEGMKPVARFFYLGRYPMYPVGADTESGISREKWKVTEVSGNPATLQNGPNLFDARSDTAWGVNAPAGLPQSVAWDMGETVSVNALSVQTHMRTAAGRAKDFVLYASDDGKTWRSIHTGTFIDTPVPQRIRLAAPVRTRFLKFEATSLHAGNALALSEIEVYTK